MNKNVFFFLMCTFAMIGMAQAQHRGHTFRFGRRGVQPFPIGRCHQLGRQPHNFGRVGLRLQPRQ